MLEEGSFSCFAGVCMTSHGYSKADLSDRILEESFPERQNHSDEKIDAL